MIKFSEGDDVVIEGLVSKPEYNGCTARVRTVNVAPGWHRVELFSGKFLWIKPSNARRATPTKEQTRRRGNMGCSGSKAQSDSSNEGGRAESGAVVPAAANQAISVRRAMC